MVVKSIKIWTIAFLSIDALFWLFMGYTCLRDQVSCLESVMFGAYFFYLPFTLLSLAMPSFVWTIVHGLLGLLVGWVLRHHPVRWWLASLIAFVVLVGVPYDLGQWQSQKELDRETKTQLWLVDQVSATEIQFRTAQQLADGTLKIDDGSGLFNLAAFDTKHTQVKLLTCQQADCTQHTLSFTEYLAAKTSCHKDKASCQYDQLENYPTLFEVTSNPQEIISMRQIDLSKSSIPMR